MELWLEIDTAGEYIVKITNKIIFSRHNQTNNSFPNALI